MNEIIRTYSELPPALLESFMHSVWVGGIFYLVLLTVKKISGKNDPRTIYNTGLLSLVVYSGIVIYLFTRIYEPARGNPLSVMNLQLVLESINGGTHSAEVKSGILSNLILLLYFAGVLGLSLKLLYSTYSIQRIVRSGISAPPEIIEKVDRLKSQMNIGQPVRVILSEGLEYAAIYRFFRPVILIPSSMLSHLSTDQIESILVHELVHLKRFDFLLNIFQHIIEILFFYNPFIWLISREIRRTRELICDDQVVRLTRSPATYAKALYNLALIGQGGPLVSQAASGRSKSHLLTRINRIIKLETMKQNTKIWFPGVLFSMLGIGLILVLSGFGSGGITIHKDKNQVPVNKPTTSQLVEPPEKEISIIVNTDEKSVSVANISYQEPDTLTAEEREELIAELESALVELKSIDWESQMDEIRKVQDEVLKELPEKLKEEQIRIKADFKFNEDEFRKELELAQEQLDSVRMQFSEEEFRMQFEKHQEEIKHMLAEREFDNEEFNKQMQETLKLIEEIDIDKIVVDIENSLEDMDMDFDFEHDFDLDIDINMDSIINSVRISIEEIDVEEMRKNVEESIDEIEKQLEQLKSRKST